MQRLALFAALLLIVTTSVKFTTAQSPVTNPTELDGILHLGKQDCPKGDLKKHPCKIFFELFGNSAQRVYEAMRTTAKIDICTKGKMKTDASGLHCYAAGDGSFGCYFGYDLARKQMTEGSFSC